jgi:hypothetical protein
MRVGEKIYHAKRISNENAEINEYAKPTELTTQFNYLTCVSSVSRGYIEVVQHGERVTDYWTILANSRYFKDKFAKGDVMWVDGEKPIENIEEMYGYGASANAVIKSIGYGNLYMTISLEVNQNRVTK